MKPDSIHILVADDHTLLRRLIVSLINAETDMTVVGEAADGEEAYEKSVALRPDILLLDLYMPGASGIEVLRRVRTDVPETTVVILSSSTVPSDALSALQEGAQGYLLKSMEPTMLCTRLREAATGEMPIATEVAKLLFAVKREPGAGGGDIHDRLTPREVEVVALVAEGASNREIGARLVLSENTVKNHIRRILEKLNLHNRAQIAAQWAGEAGSIAD